MESFSAWVEMIGFVIMIVGVIFLVYKTFNDPDNAAKSRLDVLEASCILKTKSIRESFSSIKVDVSDIKNNHLFHIENDISDIKVTLASIETALEIGNRKK